MMKNRFVMNSTLTAIIFLDYMVAAKMAVCKKNSKSFSLSYLVGQNR